MKFTYDQFNTDRDLAGTCRVLSLAFGSTLDSIKEWIMDCGKPQNFRVMRDEASGGIGGTVLLLPMGHYFGGKSVSSIGVAGVGVAPEARGCGVAKQMMVAAIKEMAGSGAALSSLYPATTALYQKVGYEQAGPHFQHSYPVSRIRPRRSSLRVEAFTKERLEGVKACYAKMAAKQDRALDRSEYLWDRVLKPRVGEATGFIVTHPGHENSGPNDEVLGYVFLTQERDPKSGRHDILASDFVATTAEAAERLVSLIGEFGSMGLSFKFGAGAMHPLMALFEEPRYLELKFKDYWMLRVLDVTKAIEERGYAQGLSTRLEIDVADEILPQNQGRWVIEIDGGKGRVTRGGAGSLCVTTRGLAALYSGIHPAHVLALHGQVAGSDAALTNASGIFASSSSGFCDHF